MRTSSKILLSLVGVALALFLALVTTVTLIFDPEDYRGYLVGAVENATGRRFELKGAIGLDVLPCCSVTLGEARLGNPAGFPDDHFASVRAASASLQLWPLILRQEVSVGAVTLDGVDVALERLADGRVNWELTGAADAEPEAATGAASPLALQVAGIRLTDGRFRYRDEQTEAAYTVSNVALETGRIDYAGDRLAAVPVEAFLTVTAEPDDARAEIELALELALEDAQLTLRRPALTVAATAELIPGGRAGLEVSADTLGMRLGEGLTATADTLQVTLAVLDTRMTVSGAGRFEAGEAEAQGRFTLAETSPRALLRTLAETAGKPLPWPYRAADDAALRRLSAEGVWRVAGSTVSVEGLDVRLDDSRLTGSASAEDFGAGRAKVALAVDSVDVGRYLPARDVPGRETAPTAGEPSTAGEAVSEGLVLADIEVRAESDGELAVVSLGVRGLGGQVSLEGRGAVAGEQAGLAGTLAVSEISPRSLLTALDAAPITADPDVLERLSGTAAWTVSGSGAVLEDMRWRLNDTTLTGSAGIDDFDTLAARFDLTVDRMNLDAYLPPDPSPEDAEAAPAADDAATEIPVDFIRNLNLEGRLRAGELVMLDMILADVQAHVSAADGVLRLDPVTATVYGGQYRGNVIVDTNGQEAKLILDQKLAAVQVGEIVQSLFGSDTLAGSLSLELRGSGLGNTPADLLKGLAGDLSLDLSEGVYRGMDVLHELRRARAALKNEAAPEAPAAQETPIRALSASGRMENGVLQTNRLTADAAGLALKGRGGINLLELALDYQLDAQFSETAANAARLSDLAGLTIPLAIAGPLTSPRIAVDLKGMLTENLRSNLEQRARDALLDRLGGRQAPAGDPGAAAGAAPRVDATPTEAPAAAGPAVGDPEPAEPPSPKDLLRRGLRDLLKPPPTSD